MKKTILIIFSFFLAINLVTGQNNDAYNNFIKEAVQLYKNKDYLQSAQKYSEAFAIAETNNINDRYDAACAWALANQIDSAFAQLFMVVQVDFFTTTINPNIATDTNLSALHADKRWAEIVATIKSNKEKVEAPLDKPLVAILDIVYQDDQQYRKLLRETTEKYGANSDEMKNLLKTISEKDSINLIKVTKILDERGWLGAGVIGHRGNSALFLVIQHADLATQEKYLPMMKDAVKKGNANASSLALLEDRIALRQGKKQIYGSQIGGNSGTGHYVLPLEDPDNVDKRRREVGLPPLKDYAGMYGITWNVEEYKKMLPEIEAKEKQLTKK